MKPLTAVLLILLAVATTLAGVGFRYGTLDPCTALARRLAVESGKSIGGPQGAQLGAEMGAPFVRLYMGAKGLTEPDRCIGALWDLETGGMKAKS